MSTKAKKPAPKRKTAKRLTMEQLRRMIIAEGHATQTQIDDVNSAIRQLREAQASWESPRAAADVANRVENVRERLEERLERRTGEVQGLLKNLVDADAEHQRQINDLQGRFWVMDGFPKQLESALMSTNRAREEALAAGARMPAIEERLSEMEKRIEMVDRDALRWIRSLSDRVGVLEHPRPGRLRRFFRRIRNLINFTPERPL